MLHLVKAVEQLLALSLLRLVKCLHYPFDLCHAVDLEPFMLDRIHNLMHPVVENLDVLLNLLIAVEILKVLVRVVGEVRLKSVVILRVASPDLSLFPLKHLIDVHGLLGDEMYCI